MFFRKGCGQTLGRSATFFVGVVVGLQTLGRSATCGTDFRPSTEGFSQSTEAC